MNLHDKLDEGVKQEIAFGESDHTGQAGGEARGRLRESENEPTCKGGSEAAG